MTHIPHTNPDSPEQQVRDFLAQFDQAREDIKTWPKWMQEAAVERAATFPKPPADGVTPTEGRQKNG